MRVCLLNVFALLLVNSLPAAEPVVLDNRLTIELVAKEPDIVTPTGLTVDEQGRVWVIENHTHQRPANYTGPTSDRIRVFSDPGEDGKFRKITTFADGFKNAMSIAFGRDGGVYLATRSDIWLLRDTKGKGAADERKVIVKLDSPGDYPHNGLSGFAFDAQGDLYFSLGENLGAPYKLIGSDNSMQSGGGEGGSIYRCRPDGSKLVRVATGFWNTFHMTFDAFGRLFAVDNDPDARGPCRLMHVVPGGDYGYRFRNGRRGLHPFTAWNGELPGTLPMVAGTAEAPSGIVAYESNGLPAEYRGKLLVTSWGDHVVEQFTLIPRGASFTAKSSVLVRGGEDFRPVAIATAPDGSLYLSDWANKSYPVHGHGRIWRIRMKETRKDDEIRPSKVAGFKVSDALSLLDDPRGEIRRAAAEVLGHSGEEGHKLLAAKLEDGEVRSRIAALVAFMHVQENVGRLRKALENSAPEVRGEAAYWLGRFLPSEGPKRDEKSLLALAIKDPSPFVRMQAILQLRNDDSLKAILPILADPDPFLASAALEVLGRPDKIELLAPAADSKDARLRLGALLALRRSGAAEVRKDLPQFLADPDPAVRRAAVQWVGEERLKEHKDAIASAAAREPVTRALFEALLAANDMLAGTSNPKGESAGEEYVARIVKDAKQPAVFRTFGLRMLRPDHPALSADLLEELLKAPERSLHDEAIRALALRTDVSSQKVLRRLAGDREADQGDRAFAILGLTHSIADADSRKQVFALLEDPALRRDALRSLRNADLSAAERGAVIKWFDRVATDRDLKTADKKELAQQMLLFLGAKDVKDEETLRKKLADLIGPAPADEAQWKNWLSAPGNAQAGERVFFHPNGPRCAVCHRIDGRGGQVGPDLSLIAASHDYTKLVESILTPSKEIAPAYTNWIITMNDGKKYTGVIVSENFDSTLTIADADGKRSNLKRFDIEERIASPKSLMPDDLHKQMTLQEFRDLLAYLRAVRQP